MREKTKAYMAGIFDAEGCLGIYPSNRDGQVKYQPVIRMCNNSRLLMKWMVRYFGGTFSKRTFHRKGYRSSVGYDWHIYDQKHISSFLSLILPYLVLKQEQAKLMIEYTSLTWNYDPGAREQLAIKVKKLKQKRVTTDTLDSSSLGRKTFAPYIAGFMDGEGSFYLSGSGGSYIKTCNTQPVVIDLVQKVYPGRVSSRKLPSGKSFYVWSLGRAKMEKFILAMLPYLVIKQPQAKALLSSIRAAEDTV